jgi:hypothetical protein
MARDDPRAVGGLCWRRVGKAGERFVGLSGGQRRHGRRHWPDVGHAPCAANGRLPPQLGLPTAPRRSVRDSAHGLNCSAHLGGFSSFRDVSRGCLRHEHSCRVLDAWQCAIRLYDCATGGPIQRTDHGASHGATAKKQGRVTSCDFSALHQPLPRRGGGPRGHCSVRRSGGAPGSQNVRAD